MAKIKMNMETMSKSDKLELVKFIVKKNNKINEKNAFKFLGEFLCFKINKTLKKIADNINEYYDDNIKIPSYKGSDEVYDDWSNGYSKWNAEITRGHYDSYCMNFRKGKFVGAIVSADGGDVYEGEFKFSELDSYYLENGESAELILFRESQITKNEIVINEEYTDGEESSFNLEAIDFFLKKKFINNVEEIEKLNIAKCYSGHFVKEFLEENKSVFNKHNAQYSSVLNRKKKKQISSRIVKLNSEIDKLQKQLVSLK